MHTAAFIMFAGAFIGGLLATTVVVFFAPTLVKLATAFGPAEYFALAVFAFLAISSVVSESIIKGLAALAIGLVFALVRVDGPSGTIRYTLGLPQLFDGISIVVITVGLLALGEVLHIASRIHRDPDAEKIKPSGRPRLHRHDIKKALPAWLRGTAFGLPFGIIPAGGSEVPTFLAYATEKRLAKRRGDIEFGQMGSIRGAAAPEAAANATAGTAMGALLALGLPTSATAAIMIAAFQQSGMQPDPLLFERSGPMVWTLLASLFIGLVILLIMNMQFTVLWAKLLLVPRQYLYGGITVLSVLIAMVLGLLAETELCHALAVSEGDIGILVSSPIIIVLYAILVITVAFTAWKQVRRSKQADAESASASELTSV